MEIKNIALVSGFLDEGDNVILNDLYMENFICKEDHFYHRIAKSLKMQGLEPVVFYPSIIKTEKTFYHKYGHQIIRVHAKKIPFLHEPLVYSSSLIKKIQEYDLCHFVSGYYIMYKVPDLFDFCVSKIYKKIPVVARWAGGNHKWLFPIRRSIKKKSLQKCHQIVCAGHEETKILQEEFQISKDKINFLMNPIDLEKFQKREKIEICKKLNYDSDYKYLLYIGRLAKNKGIENMLTAFKDILKEQKKCKLIIIGNGPLELKIKEFVRGNNIEDKVVLKNHMNHDEICYYYNISSVLINVGASGGLPNVVIEAISSKLPIVATDTGATKDFVNEKNATGVLIKNNEKEQIMKGVLKILESTNFGNGFDDEILKQFSFENFGKKLLNVYNNAYEEFQKNRNELM